jgi:arylsulfatase A-like enzyme
MKRILLALLTICICGTAHAEDRKPNIIFILADDLGWTDTGCYGSKYYETPNIDRLAAEGMRFTSGYTCGPNCAPTRAAIISGQYAPRTGTYTVGSIDRFDWQSRPLRPVDNVQNLPTDKSTIADAMKKAGYATAMFGKWHLGSGGAYHPSKRGFDEALVTSGKHFDFETVPPVEYPKGQYLADFLTDRAVGFIEKNKDKPFFLYLPHFGVHNPKEAKPELIKKFKQKESVGGHHDPVYAAMIYSVDESVGRIVAKLEELKLADNTLVIFSADNGGVGGYVREGIKPDGKDTTDNAPLRGGKGMLYEGGVRVAYIFKLPGKIKPGTTNDQPIISVDMYPTFLALAGAERAPGYALDGADITPALFNQTNLDRDAIYWHFPGYLGAGSDDKWRTKPVGAIRVGDMKLLEYFEDGKVELYDLKNDLGQTHDLAAVKPDVAKSLHAKLVAWRSEIGAKMPTRNDPSQASAKRKRKRSASEDE